MNRYVGTTNEQWPVLAKAFTARCLGYLRRPSASRFCQRMSSPANITNGERERRGARVVDRVCLENRCARKGTGGSNPSLSAFVPTDRDRFWVLPFCGGCHWASADTVRILRPTYYT